MQRYADANEPHPIGIYVDRSCCRLTGGNAINDLFHRWDNLWVRLDIFHWMRRISLSVVTTEAHPLFPLFMSTLSACVFAWQADDVDRLRRAKRKQLEAQHRSNLTTQDLDRAITKKELQR